MNKEMLDIVNDLSKKPTTELALQIMELSSENLILEQQCIKQKEAIDKAVKYIDDLRDESAERQGFYNCFPDDLYIPDINELLDILKEEEND